jgi:cytochrome c oxidase subunit III
VVTDLKMEEIKNYPPLGGDRGKKIHPHKFAMWVALASIVMMFAGLTSAFIVKSSQAGWQDIETPALFLYSTLVIVISSVTVQMAVRAHKQREMARYRLYITATALLGILFVALQFFGFKNLWTNGITFRSSISGSFLYVIIGLHALHVIGGVVALLVTFFRAFSRRERVYSSVGIEIVATYWHFVDLLWIYLVVFFALIK